MLIASKYEEIWAPEVRDFVYISDRACEWPGCRRSSALSCCTGGPGWQAVLCAAAAPACAGGACLGGARRDGRPVPLPRLQTPGTRSSTWRRSVQRSLLSGPARAELATALPAPASDDRPRQAPPARPRRPARPRPPLQIMLNVLRFNLTVPTCYAFTQRFLKAAGATEDK